MNYLEKYIHGHRHNLRKLSPISRFARRSSNGVGPAFLFGAALQKYFRFVTHNWMKYCIAIGALLMSVIVIYARTEMTGLPRQCVLFRVGVRSIGFGRGPVCRS